MASNSASGNSPLRPRFGGVVFNGNPPRARMLHYRPFTERQRAGIRYDIDERYSGEVCLDFTDIGGVPTDAELQVLNLALVTLVAQHALPLEIVGPTMFDSPAIGALDKITRMLYDIRTFCDETRFRAVPQFVGAPLERPSSRQDLFDPRRVLVLMSGGFDSTFAALALRESGYDVEALHVRANRHVEEPEENAARAIADLLGIRIRTVGLAAPDLEAIGRYYSRTFGIYPFYNAVPHGRDFVLAIIAAIVANQLGCGAIAFGHEKESRRKVIPFEGRTIYRHDVESAYGTDLVRTFIRHGLQSNVHLFSPIAGLSVYHIRAALLLHFPELSRHLAFCFWGRRCEKCLKCLSTYTMQRHLGSEPITFDQNPFADRDDRDMAVLANPDRPSEALGYGPQMHYAMRRILLDGRNRLDDYWLEVFREHGLKSVENNWWAIESLCLGIERAPEVPADVQLCLERFGLR